jgi:hypothetical protein
VVAIRRGFDSARRLVQRRNIGVEERASVPHGRHRQADSRSDRIGPHSEGDTDRRETPFGVLVIHRVTGRPGGADVTSVLTLNLGFDSVAAHVDFVAETKAALDAQFGTS